ncbi:DUF3148 domain-containing protein [Synechococcales cyanobacterium C]|uniref:DUF3148 domain-containing protein n=1 Tax=Petrachloros mirabilis ULC683 TaxID=2781853 RepID=A0A8K1ZVQ3_9CYAN|nr:DUF3148 domain-containing protein [Petrachloros mirabilis]NCJ04992.1 DUF3148 domain-containing protein [Petrachloros mirabilis ULC683]
MSSQPSAESLSEPSFEAGDRVRIVALPPYVKTAEPMPMLRPASVIRVGEEGTILSYEPGNHWSVRFERGAYLLEGQYLEWVEALPPDHSLA